MQLLLAKGHARQVPKVDASCLGGLDPFRPKLRFSGFGLGDRKSGRPGLRSGGAENGRLGIALKYRGCS